MKQSFFKTSSHPLLKLLLITDAGLITLHILYILSNYQLPATFSITIEHGFGETFIFFKEFWVILMFLFLGFQRSSYFYISWAVFFEFLLIDDYFQFHESYGAIISQKFQMPEITGISDFDVGQVIVCIIAGAVFLVIIGTTYLLEKAKIDHKMMKGFLALVLIYFFLGVGVDLINAYIRHITYASTIVTIIEDGGELIISSLFFYYLFNTLFGQQKA